MTTDHPTRHLQLEGTYNVRDTGGYATEDGQTTRWRTLLRGDSLHQLTNAGQAELVAAGLRTVIDLRHAAELAESPNVFATSTTVRYLNVPLIENAPRAVEAPSTLADIYEGIIAASHARIRQIFAALAEPGAFPALVHCTAGKDRTGIVVALLLGTAGVPAATVAADYALTETFLGREWLAERKRIIVASGGNWARFETLMGSPEELMLRTLADIEARYGGVRQYLLAIGVPRAHLDAVRAALCSGQDGQPAMPAGEAGCGVSFVHLTDLHIQPAENDRFLGRIDTMATLLDTLSLLREREVLPGATIVISGDLAHNGEPESYARLRVVVDELRNEGTTVHLALGNHDECANFRAGMLDEVEGGVARKYHYTAMLGDVRLVVLDTKEAGTHDGILGAAQLAWLRDELAMPAPGGTVIVVHHPPASAPMPALEGHMLKDGDELHKAIAGTDVIGILSGHTHVAVAELVGAVPCVTAPGTAFMLDITAREGMRFLDGGGITLVKVARGVMTAKPLMLPRLQTFLYHHRPGDPVGRLLQSAATAEAHMAGVV